MILILLLIILHQEMPREVFFESLKYLIENTILDIIDLDTIINDLHQEMFGDFFRRTEVFEVIILVFLPFF